MNLAVKRILKRLGYELMSTRRLSTELTEVGRIQELLESLFPVSTGQPLIRLGPAGDGGYLVPDDLEGLNFCFSPGVADRSSFEQDCAQRGMEVFMADHSVDGPSVSHERFHFAKKFLGAMNKPPFITFDDWVNESIGGSPGDLLVQMDIENFEYETILSMSDPLMKRIRIFIIEFHSLDSLWNRPLFEIVSRVFEKLLVNHSCVHIHPNNYLGVQERDGVAIPPLAEFTFVRKDRIHAGGFATTFPHPLDRDCTDREPVVLPACWYRTSPNP